MRGRAGWPGGFANRVLYRSTRGVQELHPAAPGHLLSKTGALFHVPDSRCWLAIETATERAGVALAHRGQTWTCESPGLVAPSRHVYEWIDALLAAAGISPAGIEVIALGAGPGSFTGVRVAAAVAQAFGHARGLPVWRVSSLAALAEAALQASGAMRAVVALDARMAEAYVGEYRRGPDGTLLAVQPDRLVPAHEPLDLGDSAGPWVAAGPGFAACPALLPAGAGPPAAVLPWLLPSAHDVLHLASSSPVLGQTVTAAGALPNYLRDRVTR
jgi:tRNA threonylcarbamoyladenosine biosynthesis protein TsaB